MRAGSLAPPAKLRTLVLGRALRLVCPQCGEGKLFTRYARLAQACSVCGLVFRREAGAQTGSMYLTAVTSQIFAVALIFCVWTLTDWSVGVSIAVTVPLVLIFCVFLLPRAQALWVAVEYVTDVWNEESWVDPRCPSSPKSKPSSD